MYVHESYSTPRVTHRKQRGPLGTMFQYRFRTFQDHSDGFFWTTLTSGPEVFEHCSVWRTQFAHTFPNVGTIHVAVAADACRPSPSLVCIVTRAMNVDPPKD